MKIIILDFSTAETFVFDYDENIYKDTSDFFESEGIKELQIRETDCQYMVVEELNIQIL
jgi:hypothetical protein